MINHYFARALEGDEIQHVDGENDLGVIVDEKNLSSWEIVYTKKSNEVTES